MRIPSSGVRVQQHPAEANSLGCLRAPSARRPAAQDGLQQAWIMHHDDVRSGDYCGSMSRTANSSPSSSLSHSPTRRSRACVQCTHDLLAGSLPIQARQLTKITTLRLSVSRQKIPLYPNCHKLAFIRYTLFYPNRHSMSTPHTQNKPASGPCRTRRSYGQGHAPPTIVLQPHGPRPVPSLRMARKALSRKDL